MCLYLCSQQLKFCSVIDALVASLASSVVAIFKVMPRKARKAVPRAREFFLPPTPPVRPQGSSLLSQSVKHSVAW